MKLERRRATRAGAVLLVALAVLSVAGTLLAPPAHADPIDDIIDDLFPPGEGNDGPGNGNGNGGDDDDCNNGNGNGRGNCDDDDDDDDPDDTSTTAPTTTPTTQAPTTTLPPSTEAPTTTIPDTSTTPTSGSSSATTDGPSPPSASGGGPSTPSGSSGAAGPPSSNRGFWGGFAALSSRPRARVRGTRDIATPVSRAAARQQKKNDATAKPRETTGTSSEGSQTVNAAAARSLRDATRADTHDGGMPAGVRLGLIALAATVLVGVLLMPRAPSLQFARRRTRQRGVATMPAGGTRRP